MKLEDFIFTEEDLIFKSVFNDYFADKKFDAWVLVEYSELKPFIDLLLLFLNEEMLRGKFFKDIYDVGKHFVSVDDCSRFEKIFSSLLLKRTHPTHAISKMEMIRNFFQDIDLSFDVIYTEITPLVQKYFLEKRLTAEGCVGRINKV